MLRISTSKTIILQLALGFFFLMPAGTALASSSNQLDSLTNEVRHQILLLPYYGIFDHLDFTIKDHNTVVLTGQVTRPYVKSDAESAVRSIKGVENVINKIEVLPVSVFDNQIRWATYLAIYSKPGFEKYAIQSTSPIRIIVKNGRVTLDGYVDSTLDKRTAEIAANSVSGVFSVTDNLKIG